MGDKSWRFGPSLLDAAERLRASNIWQALRKDQLFAVRYGRGVLYVRVARLADGRRALAVYPGEKALKTLLSMCKLEERPIALERMAREIAYTQDCITCSFVSRSDLDNWDYDSIRACGRGYRGEGQWPKFERHRPMRLPAYIGRAEARMLNAAMDAAVFLGAMLRHGDYDLLVNGNIADLEGRDGNRRIPLLEPQSDPAECYRLASGAALASR